MTKRDFLSIADLSADEILGMIKTAAQAKDKPKKWSDAIAGKHVSMLFEKPSTRTRISFEVAVTSLGGHAVVLRGDELQLGRGETIEDTGRVLSGYVDGVVVRTFGQDRLERLAAAATIPVINALSDLEHPCQALADLMTIQERKGQLEGVSLAYMGDGNNMAHSLLLAGAIVGMDVRVATPDGFEPSPQVVDRSLEIATRTGGKVSVGNVVAEAVMGADVLYTDVWTSMGQEDSADARLDAFARYQINAEVVDMAADDAIVMHCLPAHRGEEITADVIDGDRSVVWDQAENRLYVQMALLADLLG